MTLVMSSVIRRHLKDAEGYVDARKAAPPIQHAFGAEEIVGWYRNPAPWEESYVVFTTAALHMNDGAHWRRIRFNDIMHYEMPESKGQSLGIRLRTHDGIAFIRFAGRSGPGGKFSDAFALIGLLRAVVLTNQRKEEK